jgi:hypothetical protein
MFTEEKNSDSTRGDPPKDHDDAEVKPKVKVTLCLTYANKRKNVGFSLDILMFEAIKLINEERLNSRAEDTEHEFEFVIKEV